MKMRTAGVGLSMAMLAFAGCASLQTSRHPDSSGWEDVFAKDLSNAECAKPGWAWGKDGCLTPRTEETLFSKRDYRNFVLDVGYVMDPTANSGIFLYDTKHPTHKFEVQILDDHHPMYKDEVPYQFTGAIYGRCAPTKIASRPAGELNRITCWCMGPNIRIVVNGEEVVNADLTDGRTASSIRTAPAFRNGTRDSPRSARSRCMGALRSRASMAARRHISSTSR